MEKFFNEAADVVQAKATSSGLDDNVLLKLYGLYKVATVGPCLEKQPSIFNMKNRAKWSAWKDVSEVDKGQAKQQYVNLVREHFKWTPTFSKSNDEEAGEKKTQFTSPAGFGNSVSTLAYGDEDDLCQEDVPSVFCWARDDDIVQLKQWIIENVSNVDVTDSNGLTPLHWAVDRGRLASCKLLLEGGASTECQDGDGATPLDYAETCEHFEIVTLLKSHQQQANKT